MVGLVSSGSEIDGTGYNVLITSAAFNQIEAWVAQDDATSPVDVAATAVSAAPGAGYVNSGVVTLSVTVAQALTVSGSPSLSLNDGGTATYDAAKSSSTVLVFDYVIQPSQSTSALAVTGLNTNGATISTAAGQPATITGVAGSFPGLSINSGLIGGFNINQQFELIYLAYFNRAGDGGGFNFWAGQNTAAQAHGQGAATALTNIANSFAPQPETYALYPILSTPGLNLQSGSAQAALGTFINNVYLNLFGRAADASGRAYWLGQVTSGAIGLGAAALAIANGAQGADAIDVQNKVTVALDFTTRTSAAGLGLGSSLPASYVTAMHSVLSGVDGGALNDASVTAGENATSAYIASARPATSSLVDLAGPGTGNAMAAAAVTGPLPSPAMTMIAMSGTRLDPGGGSNAIGIAAGVADATIVLHAGATDTIAGFDPAAGDRLDLASLLAETQASAQDFLARPGAYLTLAAQGADAVLSFDPRGHAAGTAVAVLEGLSDPTVGLDALIQAGAIRV